MKVDQMEADLRSDARISEKDSCIQASQKQLSKVKDVFDPEWQICLGGNQGAFYCVNNKCNKHAIYCFKQQCECQKFHDECLVSVKVKVLNKQIQSKVVPNNYMKIVDKSVYEMENIICQMQQNLQKQMDLFGLNCFEKQFRQKLKQDFMIRKNQESSNFQTQITGNFFAKSTESNQLDKYQLYKEQVSCLESITSKTQRQFSQKLKELKEELKLKWRQSVFLFTDSKIVKSDHEISTLESMVKQLKASKVQIVFRGTEDGMSMDQFHQKCDNKRNLLYLVENEFGFKYGGYSPCPISIDRMEQYQTDESQSSFVFSLDINQMAKVIQKEYAVKNGKKSQKQQTLVSFGYFKCCSLMISANSLTKEEFNWISFHSSNSESSYQTFEDPPLNDQYRGTSQWKCKLRQVEVYQIN